MTTRQSYNLLKKRTPFLDKKNHLKQLINKGTSKQTVAAQSSSTPSALLSSFSIFNLIAPIFTKSAGSHVYLLAFCKNKGGKNKRSPFYIFLALKPVLNGT